MINTSLAKKINIICLVVAMISVLVLPLKKDIWYDESISILCSKGINNDSPAMLGNTATLSSTTIEQMNTAPNVYKATVLDNGNGFLFNIGLHWVSLLTGNSLSAYMLLSKLCSIAALIAFFVLCNLFFKDSLFTSLAVILLASDINFNGMSHEIRAYAMGTFFIVLAGVYFYKFMYENEKPLYLFLLGLFSVAAVLCHYFNLYVILVFLGYLLCVKKARLFSVKNLVAIMIPVMIVATYFYFSFAGFIYMSGQNKAIAQHVAISESFSIMHVIFHSMAIGAVNFRAVFPGFHENKLIVLLSFILIIGLYIAAYKSTSDKVQKRNLNLIFLLGTSGTAFLALLCFKSGHYMAMNYRYNSFCIPFACLFTTYALFVMFKNERINNLIKWGLFSVILFPSCILFFTFSMRDHIFKYNQVALAAQVAREKITKMEVPYWQDAFLIQSLLPRGYKIDYILNRLSPDFILYKKDTVEKVTVIRNNL